MFGQPQQLKNSQESSSPSTEIKIIVDSNCLNTDALAQAKHVSHPNTSLVSLHAEPPQMLNSIHENNNNTTACNLNIKSNKQPAHIKDIIHFKMRNEPLASSSLSINDPIKPNNTDAHCLLGQKSTFLKYSDTISSNAIHSPSNLSQSPPLSHAATFSTSNSYAKFTCNLNDSQSSVSSTTSNFNSEPLSKQQATGANSSLSHQASKKQSKKKSCQISNDLDEEITSKLVSDIIKNIKEKTKELESQNQSLKSLNSSASSISFNSSSEPKSATNSNCSNAVVSQNKINQIQASSSSAPIKSASQPILNATLAFNSANNEAPIDIASSPSIKKTFKKASSIRAKTIEVPLGWSRLIENCSPSVEKIVAYLTPMGAKIKSYQELKAYLLSENTCKCGLECPLNIYQTFSFSPLIESKLLTQFKKAKHGDMSQASGGCSCKHYSNSNPELEKFLKQNRKETSSTRVKKQHTNILDELNQNWATGGVLKRSSESSAKPKQNKKACTSVAAAQSLNSSTQIQDTQNQLLLSNIITLNSADNIQLSRDSNSSSSMTITQVNVPFLINDLANAQSLSIPIQIDSMIPASNSFLANADSNLVNSSIASNNLVGFDLGSEHFSDIQSSFNQMSS